VFHGERGVFLGGKNCIVPAKIPIDAKKTSFVGFPTRLLKATVFLGFQGVASEDDCFEFRTGIKK
jgi:hypothetical protein